MSGAIEAVEESLNYSFKDASLLKLALTHPSFGSPNNQRLEFLGDAVLQLCVSTRLYATMTEADEGVMTRRRALLVQEPAQVHSGRFGGIGYRRRLSGRRV